MKLLASTLMASALLLGSQAAAAQPDHDDHGRREQHRDYHGHDRHGGNYGHDHDRDYRRDHYDHRVVYRHHDAYYGHRARFVPPGHRWERGHRYYGPTYVVRDYRTYRLREPPRGYHWVRGDGGQYLLVAIATGIILDIALH